jgi:ABC-type multidrug transport system ATPase subunit
MTNNPEVVEAPPSVPVEEGAPPPTPSDDDGTPEQEMAAPVQDSMMQKPNLTLSFENLTVHVPGDEGNCCNCISNPLKNYLQEYVGMSLEERDPFYALYNVSGVVSSGEFCLVLGINEISKSTLLRALSGRLNKHDEMHGTMALNGMPLSTKSQQGWRNLTPYVSASDASHSPILTVRETLQFAADCRSADGDSKQRVDCLLVLLGLSHVADTVVGDENLRGISGGKYQVPTLSMSIQRLECIGNGMQSKMCKHII